MKAVSEQSFRARRKADSPGEDGFTLLETLIAVAILAMSMAAVLASFGWATKLVQRTKYSMEARSVAESLLAQAGASGGIIADSQGQADGGISWQLRVIASSADAPDKSRRATIAVTVREPHGEPAKSYFLSALLLIPPEKRQ